MAGRTVLYILPLIHIVCGIFHEPPSFHINLTTVYNQSDFGFSMAYQETLRRLVVGAPTVDIQGKVYSCDMNNLPSISEVPCDEKIIDLDALNITYSRDGNPEQKFYMGASIAATSDYIFTCAPLLTQTTDFGPDVFGSCIEYANNGTTYKYKSRYDNLNKKLLSRLKTDRHAGGIGWTTLIDENNDLLLIMKTSLTGDIAYTQMSKPINESLWVRSGDLKLPSYRNMGFAVTAVKFISKHLIVYAFSLVLASSQAGAIAFLRNNKRTNQLQYVTRYTHDELIMIKDDSLGSMFGAALGAADLDRDGLEDLLVGAPAYTDEETIECGALHIYLGGDLVSINNDKNRKRTIIGIKNGARFGSTIAAQDIDGDGISEIIVSAPYEDEFGAVYVLSGFDIYDTLMTSKTYKVITINNLKLTQRIVRQGTDRFGFSLQFVSDFDENGCKELAVGSPKTGAVELYNCVQTVNMTMTSRQLGEATLSSTNLTVEVCAQVMYPQKPKFVVGGIKVKTKISGPGAYIPKPDLTIDFTCESCTNMSFCENVIIEFKNKEGAFYVFTAQGHKDNSLPETEFSGSEVVIGPNSQLTSNIDISRHCNGDDCEPQLSMELLWSGSDPYVIGSSVSETVTVRVKNAGNSSYESCVRVRVRGAATNVTCNMDGAGADNPCYLPKPLGRFEEYNIEVVLDMSELTNLQADEVLEIEAWLYERCNQHDSTQNLQTTIKYMLSSNNVYVDEGMSYSRQLSDKDILDSKQFVHGIQEFLITNTGAPWYNISAVISMEKKSFIESYYVSSSKCKRNETKDKVLFQCTMGLMRNKTQKVIVTQKVKKDGIEDNLEGETLNITSQLILYFQQTGEQKYKSVSSVLTFHKDRTLVNNKWLTILIAAVAATLLLIIVIIVLCKYGFFKREKKKKLAELKETVRRRSSRRTVSGPNDAQDGGRDELLADHDKDSAVEKDADRVNDAVNDDVVVDKDTPL